METLQSVIAVMRPHQWMASVDLKDDYFHVWVVSAHHQFLRCSWQGTSYQFIFLLFGLSSAPGVFTVKKLTPLIAWLRLLEVPLYAYLDDLPIVGDRVRGRGCPVRPKDYSGPLPSRVCGEPEEVRNSYQNYLCCH